MNLGFVEIDRTLFETMFNNSDLQKNGLSVLFFSSNTPLIGGNPPFGSEPIVNLNDLTRLSKCDVIISCQSGDWLKNALPRTGWEGQLIDVSQEDRFDHRRVRQEVLDRLSACSHPR